VRLAAAFALASLAALASGQEAGQPRLSTAAPDKRIELDFQHYYAPKEIGAALAALASAYPEYVKIESAGKSAAGEDLWVATVGEQAGGDPGRRPALLLVAGLCEGDFAGAEMVLYSVFDLVQNHARDPRVAELLQRSTLYAVPCVDPDRRARLLAGADAGAAEARSDGRAAVELDRNFPSGWDPYGERCGPYPLSQPETRGLIAFLETRRNVQALLIAGARPQAKERADLPAADLELYRRALAALSGARGSMEVTGLSESEPGRGTLAEFAAQESGAFVFQALARSADGAPAASELYDLGRRFAACALVLGTSLSRIELGTPVVTRLKTDLWQVDLPLRNAGLLPTVSGLGAEHGVSGAVTVSVQGARLVAAAARRGATGEYRAEGLAVERLAVGPLAGGEELGLRLLVQAAADANLELGFACARGGAAQVAVPLK
jgi:hypothetical protein